MLVHDVADQLLDQVFESHDSSRPAVLIDHDELEPRSCSRSNSGSSRMNLVTTTGLLITSRTRVELRSDSGTATAFLTWTNPRTSSKPSPMTGKRGGRLPGRLDHRHHGFRFPEGPHPGARRHHVGGRLVTEAERAFQSAAVSCPSAP